VPVGRASRPASAPRDADHDKPVPTVGPKARYTLQVAAYKTRAEADALAKRLSARDIEDVRVVSIGKFYRVRIGRFVTRAGAVAAQRQLKARKIDTFLTDAEPAAK
jgi:cell division protein FtsN